MARSDIEFNVAKLQLDSISTNSSNIIKVAQLRNGGIDIALKMRDQELQEANIAQARQNSALQAQALMIGIEERSERINAKKETQADQQRFVETVNAGRALNGNLPPFASFKEMQLQADMNPRVKEMLSSQYQAGLTAAQTGQAVLATSPYEALKYVRATGAKITDGRSGVIKMLDSVQAQILSDAKIAPTLKKESDVAKAIDAAAQNQSKRMLGNITAGSNNIYAPPPLSVFTQDAEFAKTYISSNILTPAQQLGTEQLNFKLITNQMVNDVKSGKLSYKQMDSELGFLAEKIAGYNNSLMRYNETAGLPNMRQVNVALDDTSSFTRFVNDTAGRVENSSSVGGLLSGLFGGQSEIIVDLRDPTKRAAYINKQLSKTIPPVLREQAAKNGAK